MKLLKSVITLFSFVSLSHCSATNDLFSIKTHNLIDQVCCDLTYKDINNINEKVRPLLAQLVKEDYFKHIQFKLDLNCPFFECQSICFSPGCQLDLDVHSQEYDYDRLNPSGGNLADIREDSFLDSLCPKNQNLNIDNEEWCDLDNKDGVIIDISRNPERFTGYIPTPEQNIWGMIYEHQLDGSCPMEQKVFYQIISGFHSSVSTHLSNEWYNNETNSWEPNLDLFLWKVGNFPERIENIYFDYAIIVRAIKKISPMLSETIKYNPLNSKNNENVHSQVMNVLDILPHDVKAFNEEIVFQDAQIKEDFRLKFKNVTRLMDCVTCDRCRLWGKVQTTGYATALKILFENPSSLKKNEISCLFNTFDRLTKSIASINHFNHMRIQRLEGSKVDEKKSEQSQGEKPLDNISQQKEPIQAKKEVNERKNKKEFMTPINPKNPLKDIEKNTTPKTFRESLDQELQAVWEALKFIYSSYVNLPNNFMNLSLYKLNKWWNSFIGYRNYRNEQEYLKKIIGHA